MSRTEFEQGRFATLTELRGTIKRYEIDPSEAESLQSYEWREGYARCAQDFGKSLDFLMRAMEAETTPKEPTP